MSCCILVFCSARKTKSCRFDTACTLVSGIQVYMFTKQKYTYVCIRCIIYKVMSNIDALYVEGYFYTLTTKALLSELRPIPKCIQLAQI